MLPIDISIVVGDSFPVAILTKICTMWLYCWPHVIYHVMRWFPRNNRMKIRVVLLFLTFAILVPQLVVLARPHSARFCQQPLFHLLITCIVFTFCMIGFSVIFSIMDPVPREVKIVFHIFGFITFLLGLIFSIFTSLAGDCKTSTDELYYFFIAVSILSMISIVFFVIMIPFWLINLVWVDSMLDIRNHGGVCYQPYACCTCVWHI